MNIKIILLGCILIVALSYLSDRFLNVDYRLVLFAGFSAMFISALIQFYHYKSKEQE